MPEFSIFPEQKILWSVSYLQMLDATTLWAEAAERNHALGLREAKMREETATLNLITRLILAGKDNPSFKADAVLHSKKLESISGADLELSIHSDGKWLNLLLQAKMLHPRKHNPWRYDYWDSKQNQALASWAAKRSVKEGIRLVPGMLLYNQKTAEFENARFRSPFGQCELASPFDYPKKWAGVIAPYQSSQRKFRGTPAGISLCLDLDLMLNYDAPTVMDLQPSHFPLEHLAHGWFDPCEPIAHTFFDKLYLEHGSQSGPEWAVRMRDYDASVPERDIQAGAVDLHENEELSGIDELEERFGPTASILLDFSPPLSPQ